ncbi:MerR family transcriptional regulator [uncultured Corynebacterium sp.]|uniref:helix-turn-helix domain-containing protein n=1 Tax=uncultured Corynebacterium sp. TaxID=159447 RepID=UPI0025D6FB16|nr:MerR family transcriptional regulator [uncultured Corynebacterium sp.]
MARDRGDRTLYSISDVARGFGVSVPTLRYYEEQGLIEPTARRGRVRHYDFDELCSLAYALLWHRDADMTIESTREIMNAPASVERHRIISEHLDDIDARIHRLDEARRTLVHLLSCSSDDPRTCSRTGAALTRTVRESMGTEG